MSVVSAHFRSLYWPWPVSVSVMSGWIELVSGMVDGDFLSPSALYRKEIRVPPK